MAIFRSLRALAQNPNSKRTFFNLSSSSSLSLFPSPSLLLYHNHYLSRSTSLLSPLSKWIIPFQGPLFLSSPPWKLSQSATPFYFQSDVVFLPKIQALSLLRTPNFPVNLGLRSESGALPRLLNGTEVKELGVRDGFVESLVNLPNLISMSRLISGPFIGWMIVQEMYLPAFVGLAVSGATDWLDGYVARKMRINSVVGSYLDPLADKVLIGCVALAMVDKSLLHPGLVGLILLRDVALVGGAVYNRANSLDWEWKSWLEFLNLDGTRAQKVKPLLISKVNTVFQLVLVAAALLQPEFGSQDTQSYITYLSWLVASTTVASTAAYGVHHLRSRHLLRKNL